MVDTSNDEPLVDHQTAQERLAICRSCERIFHPTMTCKECGCFMHIKARLVRSSCPLGKWS